MVDAKLDDRFIYLSMKNCPRCDKEHISLRFLKLKKPVGIYTHFSICNPHIDGSEPILAVKDHEFHDRWHLF